jgi:hypothetical protein
VAETARRKERDNRAVLRQGAPDRWVDLHAYVPEDEYNASAASAIEVRGDVVSVCGEASRFEVTNPAPTTSPTWSRSRIRYSGPLGPAASTHNEDP